jgi:hypothetical protein
VAVALTWLEAARYDGGIGVDEASDLEMPVAGGLTVAKRSLAEMTMVWLGILPVRVLEEVDVDERFPPGAEKRGVGSLPR